ncbi:MAG: prealbumin-like fold domain-containing protein [Thermomicrobiales bacterium]
MRKQETRQHPATIGLRIASIVALMLAGILGMVTSVSAQGGSSDVAIFTTENGQPAYDACYVLVGFSNEGCDENGDGRVMFADVPWGTYTVTQTANLGSGRYVADFTINVRGNINSAGYEGFSATIVRSGGGRSTASQTSDVAIVTTENGRPAYDACYILVGFSNEGCDENGDGKITFADVPLGRYTVQQTANLGAGRSVPDFTINVTGAASADGWERFGATIIRSSSGAPSGGGGKDVSLITRDPDGNLLTDTCYVFIDHSNEGCDENGDGQVTFADMAPGTYTVTQTRTPAGFTAINDFEITIGSDFPNVPVGYLVKQSRKQNTSGTRNVSFVFVDSRTYTKVVPSPICVKLTGASNLGCDEDLVDGQIDFLDVPVGTYPVRFSNIPAGWQVLVDDVAAPSITIESGTGPQIIYIGVYTGSSGSTGSTASSPQGGLVIGCGDPVACYGAEISVLQNGKVVGRCTITTDPNDRSHVHACSADAPTNSIVTLYLDEDSLAPGYEVTENDVRFDTSNAGRASHDFIFRVEPTSGS